MGDGMDSKEILQVLWRGKYFILITAAIFVLFAFLYVIFMISPVYQYGSLLDLSSYKIKNKEMIALLEQNQVVARAVEDLTEDKYLLAQSAEVSIVPDRESVLQIKLQHVDPDVCTAAVKQIALSIIQTVSDYRCGQINRELERSRELIAALDEAIAEYLVSRDSRIINILEDDPIYRSILEEKGKWLVEAKMLELELELAKQSSSDVGGWLKDLERAAIPVPVNKKLYIVFALMLGLIISVFGLFVRHYCNTQFASSNHAE